jgi:hypothetical protein
MILLETPSITIKTIVVRFCVSTTMQEFDILLAAAQSSHTNLILIAADAEANPLHPAAGTRLSESSSPAPLSATEKLLKYLTCQRRCHRRSALARTANPNSH